MDNITKEAVAFFKQEKGLHRLLNGLIEKYRSLGRIGGTVRLANLADAEREALSTFFRKDYTGQSSASIPAAGFEKALAETRFAGVSVLALLEGFVGTRLETKLEARDRYESEKAAFFREITETESHPFCRMWLEQVMNKGTGTRGVHAAYDKNRARLKEGMEVVCRALASLPGQGDFERFPVFAERVAGDPHGLDPDTDPGNMFLGALQAVREQADKGYRPKKTLSSEAVTELLHHFGLIRDDLLNFVTCTGLLGFTDHTHSGHPVWREAARTGSVLNVPLREVIKLAACRPSCGGSAVFVVENSGVFSAILDRLGEQRVPPLICTHGQFKLAALLLIDCLAATGVDVYYSGDLDPEGLQMAQRLKRRHPSRVMLWHFDVEDYRPPDAAKRLPSHRLNKLKAVSEEELAPLKTALMAAGSPVYQEAFLADLAGDIDRYLQERT
ncbi:MAG TPA: TIGR02679 family protein [Bacillales bacterium]|nr:TIGR02679 family protein [Bacillales bacterium]